MIPSEPPPHAFHPCLRFPGQGVDFLSRLAQAWAWRWAGGPGARGALCWRRVKETVAVLHEPWRTVFISGHVSLQFEKLGYSQPWIQVPTSCVYLAGKQKNVCIRSPPCPGGHAFPGPGGGEGVTEGTEFKATLTQGWCSKPDLHWPSPAHPSPHPRPAMFKPCATCKVSSGGPIVEVRQLRL